MEISKSAFYRPVLNTPVSNKSNGDFVPTDTFIAAQDSARKKTVSKEMIEESINGIKFTAKEIESILLDKNNTKEFKSEKELKDKIRKQAVAASAELDRLMEKGLVDEETAKKIIFMNIDDPHIDKKIETEGKLEHGIFPRKDGTFVAGGGSGFGMKYLTAYDKTGKTLWKSVDLIDKTPAQDRNGNFYFAKNQNTVSYDGKGNKRWEFDRSKKAKDFREYDKPHSGDISGSSGIPAVDERNNTLYFGEWYGKFFAVDKDTGNVKWVRYRPGIIEDCSPVIDKKGNIFFHDNNGYVVSVKPDGSENWIMGAGYSKYYPKDSKTINNKNTEQWMKDIGLSRRQYKYKDGDEFSVTTNQILTGDEEKIVFGMRDGRVIALNHDDGMFEMFFDAVEPIYSDLHNTPDGKVIFGTSKGHVFCIDPKNPVEGKYGKEMKPLWDIQFDENTFIKMIDKNGKIYISSQEQGLIVLNPDGSRSWGAGISSINNMTMMPDGTVVATNMENILYLKPLEERIDVIKSRLTDSTADPDALANENVIQEDESTVNIGGIIVEKRK